MSIIVSIIRLITSAKNPNVPLVFYVNFMDNIYKIWNENNCRDFVIPTYKLCHYGILNFIDIMHINAYLTFILCIREGIFTFSTYWYTIAIICR